MIYKLYINNIKKNNKYDNNIKIYIYVHYLILYENAHIYICYIKSIYLLISIVYTFTCIYIVYVFIFIYSFSYSSFCFTSIT